jgi:hypothetical protein
MFTHRLVHSKKSSRRHVLQPYSVTTPHGLPVYFVALHRTVFRHDQPPLVGAARVCRCGKGNCTHNLQARRWQKLARGISEEQNMNRVQDGDSSTPSHAHTHTHTHTHTRFKHVCHGLCYALFSFCRVKPRSRVDVLELDLCAVEDRLWWWVRVLDRLWHCIRR